MKNSLNLMMTMTESNLCLFLSYKKLNAFVKMKKAEK